MTEEEIKAGYEAYIQAHPEAAPSDRLLSEAVASYEAKLAEAGTKVSAAEARVKDVEATLAQIINGRQAGGNNPAEDRARSFYASLHI